MIFRKRKPYVGVTGFMTEEEILAVASVMPAEILRYLIVGLLMSSETLLETEMT